MPFTVQIPDSFSVHETLHSHGWRQLAPYRWDEEAGTLQWPQKLRDGDISVIRIRANGSDINIESSVEADYEEITAVVRHILQLDINFDEFRTFCSRHEELAHVVERKQGHLLRSPTMFEDVVKVICTVSRPN
jgi:3-methyladenine DNA glycosylase/8-oxoguanine DNA glycosylase